MKKPFSSKILASTSAMLLTASLISPWNSASASEPPLVPKDTTNLEKLATQENSSVQKNVYSTNDTTTLPANGSLLFPSSPAKTSSSYQSNAVFNIWSVESVTPSGESYGSWQGVARNQKSSTDGSLGASGSLTQSNSYTYGLKVSKGALDASVQFNTTSTFTLTATRTINVPKNQSYNIDMRPIFKVYKVKQVLTQYDNAGGKTIADTQIITVYKFDGIDFKATRIG